jgi:pimeloyl-ACP methyl ester carboxylesterase
MPSATSHDGNRIYYEVTGDVGSADVVLIQGLGLSSRYWFDLPERLARVGYRVLVLDNRGVGRSEAPAGRLAYRMADMADDVAHVMDAARMPSAYVVGISMGGMIAQHVALRHAAKVQGLVLLATTCGLPHGHLPPLRELPRLIAIGVGQARDPVRALARILVPRRHQPRARELFAKWPALLKSERVRPRAFLGQLAGVAAHSTGFRLREIRCPAVVVTGDEDVLVPAKNAHVLARRLRNAHLEVISDCGHGIPILDEEVVHRALERLKAAS